MARVRYNYKYIQQFQEWDIRTQQFLQPVSILIKGKKLIHLLEITAEAIKTTKTKGHTVETNIVVCHLPRLHETAPDYEKTIKALFDESRDTWWHDVMKSASDECKYFFLFDMNYLYEDQSDLT